MTVITIKDVQLIFNCTKRTASSKLKIARIKLGKSLNVDNTNRGEPVTVEQFNEVFGLNKTLKKLTYFFVFITLSSCMMQQSLPLNGKYQETPFVVYSDKSKDEVWSKVIDVFAQKGLSINVIDKSSGIVGTNDYSFANSITHEMANDMPFDTTAWVVINKYMIDGLHPIYPTTSRGTFNVRVKEEGSKTSININLVGLSASFVSATTIVPYQIKSTGVFERTFSELVK